MPSIALANAVNGPEEHQYIFPHVHDPSDARRITRPKAFNGSHAQHMRRQRAFGNDIENFANADLSDISDGEPEEGDCTRVLHLDSTDHGDDYTTFFIDTTTTIVDTEAPRTNRFPTNGYISHPAASYEGNDDHAGVDLDYDNDPRNPTYRSASITSPNTFANDTSMSMDRPAAGRRTTRYPPAHTLSYYPTDDANITTFETQTSLYDEEGA
ncbi:hypothetical protein HK104_006837, partial [Borealophlyctis nickersoniae]